MSRKFILLLFSILFISVAYGQKSLYENDTTIVDSIVYEIDTIISIDTIQRFVYESPTEYNVVGIKLNIGETWINNSYHQNPQTNVSPELFLNFSRRKSLFSFGIQFSQVNEKIKYDIKNTVFHDTAYQKNDTVSWYGIIQNGDTVINYITQLTNYTRTDTLITYQNVNQSSILRFISIPFKYGYYIKHGYFRINLGLGLLPTFLFVKQNSNNLYMINTNKRFSLLFQPSIEISYWLFNQGFIHFSCSFQKSLIAMKIMPSLNAHINSVLVGVGFSYLFFDKKRE